MKTIISTVLLQEEAVGRAASAYINDIYVNEDLVPTIHIRENLVQFGLKWTPGSVMHYLFCQENLPNNSKNRH